MRLVWLGLKTRGIGLSPAYLSLEPGRKPLLSGTYAWLQLESELHGTLIAYSADEFLDIVANLEDGLIAP